jgi:hypothetical protein
MTELEAVAEIPTDAAERWAKQLLTLTATAGDRASLARVQDMLKRHLVGFGPRRELHVEWPTEPSP